MKHHVMRHLNESEQLTQTLLELAQTPEYARLEPTLLRLSHELRQAHEQLDVLQMPYECYVVSAEPALALMLDTYRTLPLRQAQEDIFSRLTEDQRLDPLVTQWQEAMHLDVVHGFEFYLHQQLQRVTSLYLTRFNGSYRESETP